MQVPTRQAWHDMTTLVALSVSTCPRRLTCSLLRLSSDTQAKRLEARTPATPKVSLKPLLQARSSLKTPSHIRILHCSCNVISATGSEPEKSQDSNRAFGFTLLSAGLLESHCIYKNALSLVNDAARVPLHVCSRGDQGLQCICSTCPVRTRSALSAGRLLAADKALPFNKQWQVWTALETTS